MNKSNLNIFFAGSSQNNSEINALSEFVNVKLTFFPTIEIIPLQLSKQEKDIINYADDYDFLIFTSTNAVKYFFLNFEKELITLNRKAKIVAIGKKTAEALFRENIDVDLIPSLSSSESIDKLLSENFVKGKSILIPGSKISKADLFISLENKGAAVDFIAVYDNKPPSNIPDFIKKNIDNKTPDLFVFTSPSTFNNFIKLFEIDNPRTYFNNKDIAVIGPVTEQVVTAQNIKVTIKPEDFNLASLKKEIIKFYKLKKQY